MKIKKAIVTFLTVIYVFYSCPVALFASEISGLQPVDHVYTIEPEKVSGTTGFREYETFNLTEGDMANLVFKDNYDKFINMSDSQISINGIVNTVKEDNSFADGRAIFVSGNGIVIGSSGVMNVGSLDLLSTSAYSDLSTAYANDKLSDYVYGETGYSNLITNASGNAVINGIVLSRDQVNVNASSIEIGGTAGENGIVAGWTDSSTTFTDRDTAVQVFQSLVSSDVSNADYFHEDERGTISLKASVSQEGDSDNAAPDNGITASISLENTGIAGKRIDILADSKLASKTLPFVAFGKGVYFDFSKSKIDIKGSTISSGKDLTISSIANTSSTINALELPEVILAWLLESFEDPSKVAEDIESLMSSDVYDDFAGARSYSYVDIDSSTIKSDNNLNVTTDAESSYVVKTTGSSEEAIPFQSMIHALGTETESIINITNNSDLSAFETADIKALSSNKLEMQAANDNAMFKFSETDAFSLQFIHLSTSVDTEVNISDSSIAAKEISARTLSNVDNFLFIDNSATVLKNDFSSPTEGGSGAALVGIINNSKTKNEVNISNSELESYASDKNLSIEAVSVQNIDVTGMTRTEAEGAQEKDKIYDEKKFFDRTKERFSNFAKIGKNAYSKYKSYTYGSWYSMFKNLNSKLSGKAAEGAQTAVGETQKLDPGMFQVGGSFLFSNNTNNTAVNIIGSNLKSAQDINISSHLLDKYHNVAFAHAKEPEDSSQSTAIVGAGVALIVNNRDNSSIITVDSSKLESTKDVNINALTELPGNGGTIGLDSRYLVLGFGFGTDANDSWSFEPNVSIGINDQDRQSISPRIGLTGFFNNAAAAGTTGDKLAVAASVTYNNGSNNTKIDIKNDSKIYSEDARLNAVNSVATRSDAGFFGSSTIINYDEFYDPWNSDGTGASVLVQLIENNAEVNVDASKISAMNGVDLSSATEQSYINFTKMFTDAPTIALGGAVSVQEYTGNTGVNVVSGSTINADLVKVNAGKARISLGQLDLNTGDKKGLPVIQDNRLVLADRRTAEDHITTIDVVGELSKQDSEKEKEVTAAVGAAVNVHTIDRSVIANINGSTIGATEDVLVNSTSFNRNVELALAGSLSGGASAETQNVASWQQKAKTSDKSDKFFEDMLAKIDDAFPEEEVQELEEGVDAAKDAAQKAGGSKYSFSIAGSVNVLNNDTKVNSLIHNGSNITADGKVDITSSLTNTDIILSGGFAKSGTVGTGAAVNLFSRGGSVRSTVGEQTEIISGTKTTVDAQENTDVYNFAVGVGYTGDSSKPTEFDGAIGGSFAYNAIDSSTGSTVSGSSLSGKTEGGTDVSVHAKQSVNTYNIVGALTVESGSKFSAGAALAGSADYMNSDIEASITDSVLTENINNVTVLAEEDTDLLAIGVALNAVGNYAKYGTPFDGSLGVVYLDNNIHSDLSNSKVNINKDLLVKADNQISTINALGNGAYSGATSGISFGGGWVFNIQNNKVSANLNPGTGEDYKLKASSIEVNANSYEKLNNIPVTVGISRSSSVLASTVVVNLVLNEVSTSASGNMKAEEDATFKAKDESYLLTRGGTLAVAGSQATTVIGASVNLDKTAKTVSTTLDGANVEATGNVAVLADSVDANGGTRKDDGSYDRDDISNPDYQENLLVYDDSSKQYTDIKRDDVDTSFANWNMFYNLGFGAKSTVTGAVILKFTDNNVSSALKNQSSVYSNALDVIATERIVKNIVAGSLSATENLGVGVQVAYTEDTPELNALITDNSTVGTADAVTVKAQDVKDNNTVVVAGTVAMGEGGAIDANVVLNKFEDKLNATIDSNSSIDAGELDLEAAEDVNSTRVLVQVSAAQNAAMNVQPLENDYNENLTALLDGSTVGIQGNSSTDALVLTSSDLKTRDIVIGVAAAAKGVSLSGIEINNEYNNILNSEVKSSTANINALDVNSKNHIYSDNWAILLEGTGQGLSLGANVIVNDVKYSNTSQIENSEITASDHVGLSAYSGKDGHYLRNTTGSLGVTGQGAALEANLLLNTYSNKTTATVTDSEITAKDLEIKASGKRSLDNTNISIEAAGEGAALGGSLTYNNIESDSEAILVTGDNDITLTGSATILAEDNTTVNNVTGTGSAAAVGGAAMANVVILKNKGTSNSGIQSTGNGKLDAGSVSVNANQSSDLEDESVGVALGIGSLAGTVKLVTIGEKTDYTDLEKNAGLDTAVSNADDRIKNLFGMQLSEDKSSGAFADINGNVSSKEDITVSSSTSLGKSDSRLSLNNADVTVSGGTAGVGVLSLNLSGNSNASISGGTVSSAEGDVKVSSLEADYADIKSTGLTMAVLSVSGGISSYNNKTNSLAKISDSTVLGLNIYLNSSTSADATVEIDGISLGGFAINVSGYETNLNYNSQALLTGNNNISTDGRFEIKADSNVNTSSGANFSAFTGSAAAAYMSNNVAVGGNTTALIKDATGSLNVGNLSIETGFDKLKVEANSNVVSVTGIDISVVNSGVNLNPVFTSGIDNIGKDLTFKTVKTAILTGFSHNNDYLTATSGIKGTGVSISGYAQSQAQTTSNAVSKTVLKSDTLETEELSILAYLLTDTSASAGQDSISAMNNVNSIEIDATSKDSLSIEIDGTINVSNELNVSTTHSSKTSVSGSSLAASLFESMNDLTLSSNNDSTTDVNLKGNLSAKEASFAINTDRTGSLDASNRTGGAVGISSKKFTNVVKGNSNLSIDGLTAKGDGSREFTVDLTSTNTHNDVSRSSNGGFFVYTKGDYDYEFDTNSSLTVKNSTIENFNQVDLDSNTKNIIQDSSVTTQGGFIVISSSSAGHAFSSASAVALEDSTISASHVSISSEASNNSDLDKEITYQAESGGFYTEDDLKLDNTLNQKNNISISNTSVNGTEDATIALTTGQNYRQKVDADSRGFIAEPTVRSWLTSNNTNDLTVDENSTLKSDKALQFLFDINGKLSTYSHVLVEDAGSDPETESHLTMNADNTMTLSGIAEGGTLNSVVFMGNSNNDLHQESYSEHFAIAPFTTEGGDLKRTINNTLTVTESGLSLSGNAIDYQFNSGTGNIYASNHYHCIYYAAFGYETYGETSSNKTLTTNNTANVPGKMAAGLANSKILFVGEDGQIDRNRSYGVYSSDYIVYGDGNDPTSEEVKAKVVGNIQEKIDNLNTSLEQLNLGIQDAEEHKTELETKKQIIKGILEAVRQNKEEGYVLDNDTTVMEAIRTDLATEIASLDPDFNEERFNLVLEAYSEWIQSEAAETIEQPKNILYFVENIADESLISSSQKGTFVAAASTVLGHMSKIPSGMNSEDLVAGIIVYNNEKEGETSRKFITSSYGNGENKKNVLSMLENSLSVINEEMNAYENRKQELLSAKDLLLSDIDTLNGNLEVAKDKPADEYGQSVSDNAILLHNFSSTPGSITITGIDSTDDNLSLFKDHIISPKNRLDIQNMSERPVILKDADLSGDDSLRFTINGEDLSGYISDVDLFVSTNDPEVSLQGVTVNEYGLIRGGDKTAEVFNDSMELRDGVLVQMYTSRTGAFDFSMDSSPLVVTTAPVLAASPELVVKNYFGYHTAETFGYSEASALSTGMEYNLNSGESSEDDEPVITSARHI